MNDKLGFEIEVCGRCGGGGHYSYCQRFGTKCFGCGGTGRRYTKRGAIAKQFYEDSLKVPANSIQVGDLIQCERWAINGESSMRYFAPVVEIEEGGLVTVNG